MGRYLGRLSVQRCYEKTLAEGYRAFGLQNGGECWSSVEADHKYNMYGPASNCKNGKGQYVLGDPGHQGGEGKGKRGKGCPGQ